MSSQKVFKPPKGMQDIPPDEMAIREWVYDKIKQVFRNYGVKLVETTFVEEFQTLAAKSGPDIKEEIYYFKDKSGRELGLRFDLTVGIARLVANNPQWPIPLRLGAISCMWRYDQPGYGRRRWFYQWNVEYLGEKSVYADVEAIALGIDVFLSFNYNQFIVKIGHRQIAEHILLANGAPESKIPDLLRIIDKFQKLTEDQLIAEFAKYGVTKEQFFQIKSALRKGKEELLDYIEQTYQNNTKILNAVNELRDAYHALKSLKKEQFIEIDLSIVRGIGYYTGIVWEAYDLKDPQAGSIFGGGRYDSLVGLYGPRQLPATGLAGGIERLLIVLKQHNLIPPYVSAKPAVFVANIKIPIHNILPIVQELRNANIPTIYNISGWKIKKALSYANNENINYVLIIGEQELKNKEVTVKVMNQAKEVKIPQSELISFLKMQIKSNT